MRSRAEVTAEVAAKWIAAGRMTLPPDTPSSTDDEQEFWDDVERRCAEVRATEEHMGVVEDPAPRRTGGEDKVGRNGTVLE